MGYFIFTNEKLGEKIYIANSVEFEGSFVTFKPSYSIEKSKKSELEGTSVTLPEHVIKEIVLPRNRRADAERTNPTVVNITNFHFLKSMRPDQPKWRASLPM